MRDPHDDLPYPVDSAFRLLGRRWGPEVLFQIVRGTRRYSRLQKALRGVSPRTLSLRILELENAGVITKAKGNQAGAGYQLTKKGRELAGVLDSVASFSIKWHRAG